MKKLLNLSYSAIHGTYWMYFAAVMSFASVFLLGKNYSNTEIGIILSTASILAVIMQPLLADLADRSKRATLTDINGLITIGLILATVTLFFFPVKSLFLSLIFVIIAAWHISQQPLLNAMAFYLSGSGHKVNFGVARSVGSFAYAVLCAILGVLVARFGIAVIPASAVLSLMLLLISLAVTGKLYKKTVSGWPAGRIMQGQRRPAAAGAGTNETADERADETVDERTDGAADTDRTIGLAEFAARNKAFIVFTAGIVLTFFQSSVLSSFLIQIIAPIGGTSTDMGRLFCFIALMELPGLAFFSRIRERFSCQFLLKLASVATIFKIFFVYLAASVSFVYVAFAFQAISYPIYLSASVHLVDEVMEKGEAVKGQSLIVGAMTLSNVFANFAGGVILDCSGAPLLLLISTALCALGTLIIFLAVGRIQPKRQPF